MSDDFNTAKTLAVLFEMAARINDFKSGNVSLNTVGQPSFELFIKTYKGFFKEVLGLDDDQQKAQDNLLANVINILIDLRKKARADKNFALSDKIRDDLKKVGVQLMDGKDGGINFSIE